MAARIARLLTTLGVAGLATSRPQVMYDLQGDGCDELDVNENDPVSFSVSYTLTPAISLAAVE